MKKNFDYHIKTVLNGGGKSISFNFDYLDGYSDLTKLDYVACLMKYLKLRTGIQNLLLKYELQEKFEQIRLGVNKRQESAKNSLALHTKRAIVDYVTLTMHTLHEIDLVLEMLEEVNKKYILS